MASSRTIRSRAYGIATDVAPVNLFSMWAGRYPSAGVTIYVDPTGNDANSGSQASPKLTHQGAVNVATVGTRIVLRAGTYAPADYTGKNGTISNWIQVVGETGAKINVNGDGQGGCAFKGACSFVAVYGVEFYGLNVNTGGHQYESGVVVQSPAHSFAVWNCYFHDMASHAVAVLNTTRVDVCYNRCNHLAKWNEFQASAISFIGQPNSVGTVWSDGYMNHIVGNVIDAVWEDASLSPLTDGNGIICDESPGYTGRTLVAQNLVVGCGGRGIHTLSTNHVDAWFNTVGDNIQNLPGSVDADLSIFTADDCNFQYNVCYAKPARDRVGYLNGTSTWNSTVFLRGDGGSGADDPAPSGTGSVDKISVGPAAYFQNYQAGVFAADTITSISGFRPTLANVSTFIPSNAVKAVISPWPDALGYPRPSTPNWAYGAFESVPTPPGSPPVTTAGVHWGYDITQDGYNMAGGFSANAVSALNSIPKAMITSHIGGFGIYPPETSLGVYDWGGEARGVPANGLDDGVQHVRNFSNVGNGIDAIILCTAPGWMKPSGNDFAMDEAPTLANRQNFADECAAVVARYTDVQWYPFWNEFKGMFNGTLNRYDYEQYVDCYNRAYAAMKAVRPSIKIGGPYIVSSSWSSGATGSGLGVPPCTFTGGEVDGRALDVYRYFKDHATGYDFIAADIWVGNQFGTTLGSGVTNLQQCDKFVKQLQWIRTNIEPTKPIVVTEFYPSAGGLSQAEAEDMVLSIFALVRDNVTVGDGIWFLQWGEAAEPPIPFNYTTGAASGLIAKLIAWEAAQ